jgi:hypothetical protein
MANWTGGDQHFGGGYGETLRRLRPREGEQVEGSGNDSRLGSLDSPVLGGVERKEHPTGTRPLHRES